ncbi:DUF4386 family protein [Oryzobacter telluris]|uniref:DUF4386 family protein n=1 Tax=Oryzobacter telluris TaxID=3149179 RepID=UPI00370D3BB2
MTTIATRPATPATRPATPATRPATPTRRPTRPTHADLRTLTATERRGARLAGASLLVLTLVSLPAAALLGGAAAPGDRATRVGIGLAFLVVAVLDVVAAWGLHLLLRRRATPASTAQLVSRSGYAVLLAGAAVVLTWPGGAGTVGFERDWSLALVVFGLHLVIAGIALWRSRIAPKAVAVITAVAGLAYLLDDVLTRAADVTVTPYLVPLMLGELVLLGWLLRTSRRPRVPATAAAVGAA